MSLIIEKKAKSSKTNTIIREAKNDLKQINLALDKIALKLYLIK